MKARLRGWLDKLGAFLARHADDLIVFTAVGAMVADYPLTAILIILIGIFDVLYHFVIRVHVTVVGEKDV